MPVKFSIVMADWWGKSGGGVAGMAVDPGITQSEESTITAVTSSATAAAFLFMRVQTFSNLI
jgi:hypothetical protein